MKTCAKGFENPLLSRSLIPIKKFKMSCSCKLLQRRLEKMQRKYITLKRNHKKLLGISILLTDALEELIRGGMKTGINETLQSCSTIYPDLFGNVKANNLEVKSVNISNDLESKDESGNDEDEPATESQREYFEGFLARPKIPRTPQV